MEKEKLIIKNFGPIKEVDLDLGSITVLIGEQATGKSTVAKVLAVCRYFSYIVDINPEYHHNIFGGGLHAWGLFEYIKNDTYILYSCKHYSLSYECFTYMEQGLDLDNTVTEYERREFHFSLTPLSEEFKALMDELDKIRPKDEFGQFGSGLGGPSFWTLPTSFLNSVKNVIDFRFYFPAERSLQSLFSLGQKSISSLPNFLYDYYAAVDGILRNFNANTDIEPLAITYKNQNGVGLIKKKDEKDFYLLANAASGYQAIIPIVLVMKHYNEVQKRRKTLLIEEPELNLFPSAQNKLIQYLVEQVNKYENILLLTTHSPYTLTSLNNLMYAYQVGQVHQEKVAEKIDKKYWLNPNDVSAYMMKTDGTAENIIDDEGLIKAEKIDEVSRAINKEFNDIMDIELGVYEAA